jgi:hypothetical protein
LGGFAGAVEWNVTLGLAEQQNCLTRLHSSNLAIAESCERFVRLPHSPEGVVAAAA